MKPTTIKPLRSTSLLIASLAFSGCVAHIDTTAHAQGRVISAATHKPVQAAQVTIEDHPQATTLTARDGSFDIPPLKEWIFIPMIFPVDYFPASEVIVAARGYRTTQALRSDYSRRPIALPLERSSPIEKNIAEQGGGGNALEPPSHPTTAPTKTRATP